MLIRTRLKCKFKTQMLLKLWVEAGCAFCLHLCHLNPGKYKRMYRKKKRNSNNNNINPFSLEDTTDLTELLPLRSPSLNLEMKYGRWTFNL